MRELKAHTFKWRIAFQFKTSQYVNVFLIFYTKRVKIMRKLSLISLVLIFIGQSENAYCMKSVNPKSQEDSPVEEKKIVRKGFRPAQQFSERKEEASYGAIHQPVKELPLLHDQERNMDYYGTNLTDASRNNQVQIAPDPIVIDENAVIFTSE